MKKLAGLGVNPSGNDLYYQDFFWGINGIIGQVFMILEI